MHHAPVMSYIPRHLIFATTNRRIDPHVLRERPVTRLSSRRYVSKLSIDRSLRCLERLQQVVSVPCSPRVLLLGARRGCDDAREPQAVRDLQVDCGSPTLPPTLTKWQSWGSPSAVARQLRPTSLSVILLYSDVRSLCHDFLDNFAEFSETARNDDPAETSVCSRYVLKDTIPREGHLNGSTSC